MRDGQYFILASRSFGFVECIIVLQVLALHCTTVLSSFFGERTIGFQFLNPFLKPCDYDPPNNEHGNDIILAVPHMIIAYRVDPGHDNKLTPTVDTNFLLAT